MDLEDIGAKFSRDRTFCFDHLLIHEVIFDETNDVTLFCTVPYFGKDYAANFGLTFDQLNTILRNTHNAGKDIANALADQLEDALETPSVIDINLVYGKPLEVGNFIFYTTLYDIGMDEDMEEGEEVKDVNDDEEDEFEAYAFLIDEILPKKGKLN